MATHRFAIPTFPTTAAFLYLSRTSEVDYDHQYEMYHYCNDYYTESIIKPSNLMVERIHKRRAKREIALGRKKRVVP